MLAECGKMILGSDSHTRYGAIGTMAMGEGGPELVKQLLSRTYDIKMPGVIAIYLTGAPQPGVGPQDIALAIIGEVFANGYVKNKVMEFVGPGVSNLSMDYRIGVDVMTTETACLSSIWRTDDKTKEFLAMHGRADAYKELNPGAVAYYDGVVSIDLSKVRPMIALPFHPSNTYTIEELNANLGDILRDCEIKSEAILGGSQINLVNKIKDGKLMVDQGIIAGCAGGGYENICVWHDCVLASGREREKKKAIFTTFFSYLSEDVLLLLESEPENEEYKSWAEWLECNYKTLKRLILQKKSTISMGIKLLTCTKGGE